GSRAANNSASNQYLDVGTSTTTLAGDGVVLATTSQTTPVRYRTTSGAPFALVVVSSSDPGVSNYPDGTLWIQT
ncbi:MAG: hypothetical protein EBR40_11265, partial [Proteobacteria bacterium]|nr:hypothetical protein [Pseudomonadota bacterium]